MTILGIDTHRHVHAAVALDDVGRRLDGATFGTDDRDHAELLAWARSHGPIARGGSREPAATATGLPPIS